MKKIGILIFIGSCIIAFLFWLNRPGFCCERLTCESVEEPIGIDARSPHFGWNFWARQRNQKQTAFELIVSDNLDDIKQKRGNLWNTGIVRSSQNIQLKYSGEPLQSFQRYYWRVRAFDKKGDPSPWSDIAQFETAILDSADWTALWVGDGGRVPESDSAFYGEERAPLFKKEFETGKKIESARLYITGVGYYEAYINGNRVGDRWLDPGWTSYREQVLYSTYDVTSLLHKGANAIGIMAGNGWYNPLPLHMWCSSGRNLRLYLDCGRPTVKAQLRICYTDGSLLCIKTDRSWITAPGPIVRNSIYLGEHFDARLEQPGWACPDYKLNGAKPVTVVSGPAGGLTAQMQPPIRVIEVLKPVAVTEPAPQVYLFDMGRNFAGVARIKVTGPSGAHVTLRYGEDIFPDGSLNVMTSVAGQMKGCFNGEGAPKVAWQEDSYILRGDKEGEAWNPRFTFHGFRYVEVSGWPGTPGLNDIEGLVLSSDVSDAGFFHSSNEMFNTLNDNARRSFRSNLFSVQSDCPAREKFAYGGDMFCTTEAFIYNYDMANLYRKIADDHRLAQRPQGGIPETAPYVGIADNGPGDGSGPLGFQLGYTFLIDRLYEFYGDRRTMEEHYPALKKQADFLIAQAKDHLYDGGLSDHESLDTRSYGLTESLFYYKHIELMTKYARILNRNDDAHYYAELVSQIRDRIVTTYYHPESGRFAGATQTDQLFGLWHRLLPENEEERALSVLDSAFINRKGHLSTGIFGTKMMFDVLRLRDLNSRMYDVVNKRDYPGWGYMIEKGATSLWETWAYSDNVYSQNHPMFGSVSEWFFRSLLGINPLLPGFEKILIKPQPAGDLTRADGRYRSVRGDIESHWQIKDGFMHLDVTIPVNTVAEVWLPALGKSSVTESGKLITTYQEIKLLKEVPGYMVYSVGSGTYHFKAEYYH